MKGERDDLTLSCALEHQLYLRPGPRPLQEVKKLGREADRHSRVRLENLGVDAVVPGVAAAAAVTR